MKMSKIGTGFTHLLTQTSGQPLPVRHCAQWGDTAGETKSGVPGEKAKNRHKNVQAGRRRLKKSGYRKQCGEGLLLPAKGQRWVTRHSCRRPVERHMGLQTRRLPASSQAWVEAEAREKASQGS